MQGSGSEVLEIRIGDLNHSGEGVGRKDGRVVFVPHAAPGDVAVVRVTENKRSFARAELLSLARESPDRALPPCPVYLKCGGCQLQHISYEAQLAYKTRRVKQALERIGKLEHVGVRDCLPAPKVFHYRNKARFSYEALPPHEVGLGCTHVPQEGQEHGFPEADYHLDGPRGLRGLPGGGALCRVDTGTEHQRRFIAGFYGRRTRDVVDLNECIIQNPTNNRVFEALNELVAELGTPVCATNAGRKKDRGPGRDRDLDRTSGWSEDASVRAGQRISQLPRRLRGPRPCDRGALQHLVVRCAGHGDKVLAVLVSAGGPLPAINDIARGLTARVSELTGVIEDVGGCVFGAGAQDARGPRAMAGLRVVVGQEFLYESILGLRFIVSAESFLQVNPEGVEVLYREALRVAGLTGDEVAVDAYCGIGTISLLLARGCRHVYGIEAVEAAVTDAERNAALNHISNCTFITGRVEEILATERDRVSRAVPGKPGQRGRTPVSPGQRGGHKVPHEVDLVVLDPPRAGCDRRALDAVVELRPRRIVYVSCDPETLARDLGILKGWGYKTVSVQPVDMFPQTAHVESVAMIDREKTR